MPDPRPTPRSTQTDPLPVPGVPPDTALHARMLEAHAALQHRCTALESACTTLAHDLSCVLDQLRLIEAERDAELSMPRDSEPEHKLEVRTCAFDDVVAAERAVEIGSTYRSSGSDADSAHMFSTASDRLRTLLHSSCVQFTANGRNSDDTANQKVLLQLTEQFRAMQM